MHVLLLDWWPTRACSFGTMGPLLSGSVDQCYDDATAQSAASSRPLGFLAIFCPPPTIARRWWLREGRCKHGSVNEENTKKKMRVIDTQCSFFFFFFSFFALLGHYELCFQPSSADFKFSSSSCDRFILDHVEASQYAFEFRNCAASCPGFAGQVRCEQRALKSHWEPDGG